MGILSSSLLKYDHAHAEYSNLAVTLTEPECYSAICQLDTCMYIYIYIYIYIFIYIYIYIFLFI